MPRMSGPVVRQLWRSKLLTKRSSFRIATVGAVAAVVLAACSSGATTAPSAAPSAAPSVAASAPASTGASAAPSAGTDLTSLIAAAKAEGGLSVVALPRSWCGYGAMLDAFTAKYGIPINSLNPDGSSQQELDAITANKGNTGPAAPDVIDVGLSYGPKAVSEGLVAPYKVSTWSDIPDSAKDATGYWYGDYYGVMSFEVNTSVVTNVPQDWPDLLKAGKNQVALAGDPTGSNQAVSAVWAAALANGGSLDNAQPGLDFFKQLNDAGIFVPVIGKQATVATGETPIVLRWTYNALADKDSLKGNPPITVVVPKNGRLGGMYVQAISAFAPHPNAAKLWMEYLYSDEGQIGWMNGYCSPIRYDAMVKANAIPADVAAKLPESSGAASPDARPDHQGQRRDHQGLADRRRRPRQVVGEAFRFSPATVTDLVTAIDARDPRPSRPGRRRAPWTVLGVVPFFLFAIMFLVVPTSYLVVGSFRDEAGAWTVQNYLDLSQPRIANAYLSSIEISLVTSLVAGVFGFLLAYAVIAGGLPRPIRTGIMTFSGVASNFAGVPLALAFIFTIGRTGFVTVLLKAVGWNVYDSGFTIYSKIGLEIVYLYFQLPLMVLIIAPAIDGLKTEWREASENAGASTFQYWRYIGLPVLLPSLLGAMILLFGNAFGAQATAFALTGGFLNLVTILIGSQLSGDTLGNQNLGYALAMGMVAIMGVTLVAYSWLTRRAERWQR